MADTKLSDLAALTGANTAAGDLLPIVDVSDTSMAAGGTNKSITRDELSSALSAIGKVQAGDYTPHVVGTIGDVTPTNGKLVASPIVVWRKQTFDRLYLQVSVLQSGSLFRLGIYTDLDRKPDALVVDGGTIDASTTGAKTVTISTTLDPGVYWLTAVSQSSGSVATVKCHGGGGFKPLLCSGDTPSNYAFSVVESIQSNSSAYTSGALPGSFGASAGAGGSSSVAVFLRGA